MIVYRVRFTADEEAAAGVVVPFSSLLLIAASPSVNKAYRHTQSSLSSHLLGVHKAHEVCTQKRDSIA